jgi:hypothetical protein
MKNLRLNLKKDHRLIKLKINDLYYLKNIKITLNDKININ